MKVVKINTEYITLGQFLKFAGIISNGGEAKSYLADAVIHVNGELDMRRGRKLYPGMTVNVKGHGEYKVESI